MNTNRVRQCVAVFLIGLIAANVANAKGSSSSHSSRGSDVSVRGYTKSNGTYVSPHHRSAPDGNFSNNWSTLGNVNPYTGKPGTLTHPPDGYGRSRGFDSPSQLAGRKDATARNTTSNDLSANGDPTADSALASDPFATETAPDEGSTPIPPKAPVVKKTFTWPAKQNWATDKMTAAERVEHAELSAYLKSHGVNLVFWDKYSLDQLYEFEHQLNTTGRVSY